MASSMVIPPFRFNIELTNITVPPVDAPSALEWLMKYCEVVPARPMVVVPV